MTRAGAGRILTTPDTTAASELAAQTMSDVIRNALGRPGRNHSVTVALSGGESPREAYSILGRKTGIDWGSVRLFWVDERAVPPTSERSNYRWAKSTLIDSARIEPDRVHRMRAELVDLDAAAREYEQLIRRHVAPDGDGVPAFDLMVMGIGGDGHTASLFPGSPELDIFDRLVVAVPPAESHEARLTLTRTTIAHARSVLVLALGPDKRPVVERARADDGDVRQTPARVLRDCTEDVAWIVSF